jgi:hypothetical protein
VACALRCGAIDRGAGFSDAGALPTWHRDPRHGLRPLHAAASSWPRPLELRSPQRWTVRTMHFLGLPEVLHDHCIVTSTPQDKRMQIDPTAVAARHPTVPLQGADPDPSRSIPYAELAERVATHGPDALRSELHRLTRDARCRGVTPLLVTILADPSPPDVARQRAFGRFLAELERRNDMEVRPVHTQDDGA